MLALAATSLLTFGSAIRIRTVVRTIVRVAVVTTITLAIVV
jgi:hypothetical protein